MKRSRLQLLGAAVLALLGSGVAAQEPPPTADAIPQAWIVYAQRVSERLQSALEGGSEPAQRFHAYFASQAAAGTQTAQADPPFVRVKVWLARSGRVTRVAFDGIGDAQAAADLQAVLLRQQVGAVPPRTMRQPVVIRLSLAAQL